MLCRQLGVARAAQYGLGLFLEAGEGVPGSGSRGLGRGQGFVSCSRCRLFGHLAGLSWFEHSGGQAGRRTVLQAGMSGRPIDVDSAELLLMTCSRLSATVCVEVCMARVGESMLVKLPPPPLSFWSTDNPPASLLLASIRHLTVAGSCRKHEAQTADRGIMPLTPCLSFVSEGCGDSLHEENGGVCSP